MKKCTSEQEYINRIPDYIAKNILYKPFRNRKRDGLQTV